jgi:hypothetical protein
MRHPRQLIAWFCIAASLWMGAGFQLHALEHSLHALETSQSHDSAPEHEPACERCLLFASVDGALPTQVAALASVPPAAPGNASIATPLRATAFTAYASRAPPQPC